MKLYTLMSLYLLLALSCGSALAQPRFPLRVSDNRRYFVDQNNKPFLYNADTGWQIYVKLTTAEARYYLMHRKSQGFNTIQTQLAMDPAQVNRDGYPIFDNNNDFSKPNKAYHDHVARVIALADSLNLLIVMSQPWLGCCEEAFGNRADKPIQANGTAKNRGYGQWLGRRFAGFDNLFWIIGGDNDPKGDRAELVAFAEGLHETAPAHQLLTYHASPPHSSTDLFQYADWLGFSMIYTYWRDKPGEWVNPQYMMEAYEAALREYNKSDVMPFILGESQYEGFEGNDIGTPHQVRRQPWWTILCGGAGHAYGSRLWYFPDNWRDMIDYPGSYQLKHFIDFFEQLDWWTLVPDQRHKLVVAGYGQFMKPNYVAAALSQDGELAVAYLPERTTLVVDFARMAGAQIEAQWYNPITGEYSEAGRFPTDRLAQLTPPGNQDWALLLQTR
ncbi:DUF4038 domain-containing protein [candidate division KSB1 bacterium]|nr:DUF4038 domain-containing protein [candidate division KSB1 bacterium]